MAELDQGDWEVRREIQAVEMAMETLKDGELDDGLGDTETMMSNMSITDCFCISTDEA